jgi:hypothetical protein
MFGLGMSAKDKWILEQTAQMVAALAAGTGEPSKALARRIFDETKAEAAARYGDNMYSESNGDRLVQNQAVLAKRTAAGLTVDDVRNYWNTPVLLALIQLKVLELTDFAIIHTAEKAGKGSVSVARERRKTEPRYGDPEKWSAAAPANQNFSMEDADIYPEFMMRVGRWQEKTPRTAQAALLSQHSSFNAMVRALVRQGEL